MFDYGVKLDIVRDFIFFETNAPMFSGHFGNYIFKLKCLVRIASKNLY